MKGYSLAELLVALVLAGVVSGALFGLLRGQERLARAQADGIAAAEAIRLSAFVLAGELRLLDPAEDIARAAPESLAVRAFRAFAVVCGASAGDALVRVRGARAADPAKDSVLLIRPDSAATPVALAAAAAAPGACAAAPGEQVERWTLGTAPPPAGSAALVFESGTYSFTGAALRYRRGAGGRQPLTVQWLDDAASGFRVLDTARGQAASPADAAALAVRVAAAVPPAGSLPARRFGARLFFALLNGAAIGGAP